MIAAVQNTAGKSYLAYFYVEYA